MIHQSQPVFKTGATLARARAAMIMIHGRGATAESILTLASEFDQPDFAYLAPQAAPPRIIWGRWKRSGAGGAWYPNRFLAPIASNEPWLSSALNAVGETITRATEAGIPRERIMLLGFSQGACLALEYAARHSRRQLRRIF